MDEQFAHVGHAVALGDVGAQAEGVAEFFHRADAEGGFVVALGAARLVVGVGVGVFFVAVVAAADGKRPTVAEGEIVLQVNGGGGRFAGVELVARRQHGGFADFAAVFEAAGEQVGGGDLPVAA